MRAHRGYRKTVIAYPNGVSSSHSLIPHCHSVGIFQAWNCELDLRALKQSMHMDVLRCKTPEMVRKEIFAHLLAYNLLRGVMTESAKRNDVMPRQLSVKGAMQAVESFTPAMMSTDARDVLYDALLTTVSSLTVLEIDPDDWSYE